MCGRPLADAPTIEETRRTVTVLFSDLAGSTALGERLDPEAIRRIMSRYFGEMQTIIERHGGRLEKFIGDAVKADFGAPVAHEDDALRAVRAALEMRDAQERLNQEFEQEWGVRLAVRTGVNTGEVVAATGGDHESLVLGDTVNTAARFEQGAAPGEILLGQTTYRLVRHAVDAEPVEPLTLKGKADPVPAYRLISLRSERPAQSETPFIDRGDELAILRNALAEVLKTGRSEAVAIVGDAGVGKSRLVSELNRGADSDAVVVTGRCLPYGEGTTYRPVAEIVRQLVGLDDSDGDAALEELRASLAGEPEGDLVSERLAVVLGQMSGTLSSDGASWAVSRLIEAVGRERPVVVVLEDVHWAEDSLLELIEYLASALRNIQVLVLATARPELMERRDVWASGHPDIRALILEPMLHAQTSQLVHAALGAADVPAALTGSIASASEGNPLFVEETLAMLQDTGMLQEQEGRWVATADVNSLAFPSSLSLLVQARIDALARDEQDLLSRAAVIGRLFTGSALETLVEGDVDELLGRLEGRRCIEPDEVGTGGYRFRNGVLRDVAYARLPKLARAEFHERLANWAIAQDLGEDTLDELAGSHLERAFHLRRELGAVTDRARDLALRGGVALARACRRSMARGDAAAAHNLLGRAEGLAQAPGMVGQSEGVDFIAAVGKLAVTLGRWELAVEVLSPHVTTGHPPILRDIGVALCKLHSARPQSSEYAKGQSLLKEAADKEGNDADAFASLAGTWKGLNERRAAALYRRALDVDHADPYALGNVLEYEVLDRGDLSPMEKRRDAIAAAVERCRKQADRGENLPWAYYDMGKFLLLLGRGMDSLGAYAKAIHVTTASYGVEGALSSLANLESVRNRIEGYDWTYKMLIAARSGKFGSDDKIRGASRTVSASSVIGRVVMMTGGSASDIEDVMQGYRQILLEAFEDFDGVLVSGGTPHGVGRLAGDVGEAFDRIRTIGYVPKQNRDSVVVDKDPKRYREIRMTEGTDFSPLEALEAWLDMLASGVGSSSVRVLGIGGGEIAALEYRVALALGASVGIIRNSGREADKILRDTDWVTASTLIPLRAEVESLRSFLQ